MDAALIALYSCLAVLHSSGIAYNIYAISLPEVSPLHKIQVFLLLISLMPVLSTDIIIVSYTSWNSSSQFDNLIRSFDIFAVLSYHVFFTNYILGMLGQVCNGLGTSFYPNYISALAVKALAQPVVGFVGFSLLNLSHSYQTSTFICCYHAIGLVIVSSFVLSLKLKLHSSNAMLMRMGSSSALSRETAQSAHGKVVNVNSINVGSPAKMDRSLQHINDYSKSLFTKTTLNLMLAIIVLGICTDGSTSSSYYISLTWKFTMGLSGILATKSTVDFHQSNLMRLSSR